MKKSVSFFLIFSTICIYGQIENRWQPDSVYSNRQVKQIIVYLNSPKDLSEIVELDRSGKKIRSTKYSTSYNRRTRKSKRIEQVNIYQYNHSGHLIEIIDSLGNNSISFEYGSDGKLEFSRKKLGNFSYETKYYYSPYRSITTRRNDSIILYEKTKEYDKDFYVSRFYGYYLEPKLKKVLDTINGVNNIVTYKDYHNLEKFNDDKRITNFFDEEGRLIKSDIHTVFMNDRVNEYQLKYEYYNDGLLKSILGYIPRYFEYVYWE